MISPMTPAGTKIVCIDDIKGEGSNISGGLSKGEIYTVLNIIPSCRPWQSDYCAVLEEIDRSKLWAGNFEPGFNLVRFRRLITPEDFAVKANKKERENV